VTRELVYGRQPVREVVRAGKRQLFELLATERALAAEPWLREAPGLRLQVVPERRLNEAARTTDHQGVVAFCEPYRYADAHALAAGESPLVVCLDQVTDPHNLGAVIRSAEGAGASGIAITERNAARVTPAVCKVSAGAVEHLPVAVVVNLARYLEEIKGPRLWVWAADGAAETPVWSADLAGGVALVFGAEGRGLRPGVRRACDGAFSIPLAGSVESLNVSVAAGVSLFEAARQRRGE
jgi:23S rRNA (guanosine2251-2'-O)-methyltransferase